ncbi:lactonase family protein [Pseudomonas stutzeri]|nr:lactonase family protein [Stutzerimonas stutzeri]MCQ4325095.1 lactonase family protein [Stutzerimonas stutzeri]
MALAATLALSTPGIAASMSHVLIGSYTHDSDSPGIHRLRFDAEHGQLQPLQTVASHNPSWLVLDQQRRRLYATNENGPGHPDPVGRVSAFAIGDDGELRPLGQASTLGDEPTHASLSIDGRYLFVSNYGSRENPGGSLAVLPLDTQGRPQPVTQLAAHQPSGVHPERQRSAHVHSAVPAPDGRRLFVSDLGADRVFVYRYDPANAERPLQPAEPASIALPPGSGPRHLVFAPDGRSAYLTLELSAQVARFAHVDGQLIRRQLIDLAEPGTGETHSPGAIHTSADGRFLYVSDRGDYNHIIVFAIEADGALREIQRRASEGRAPREFAITPDGRFLLVANQLSDSLVLLRRDPDSGLLGETLQTLPVGRPSDIKFIE